MDCNEYEKFMRSSLSLDYDTNLLRVNSLRETFLQMMVVFETRIAKMAKMSTNPQTAARNAEPWPAHRLVVELIDFREPPIPMPK